MLGIVPQMFNFDVIEQQPQSVIVDTTTNVKQQQQQQQRDQRQQDHHNQNHPQLPHQLKCWRLLSITICIAFACGYPYSIWKLLQNSTNDKKGVNNFIIYIYYGAKYFVILIIYTVQFRNDKQFQCIQTQSYTVYRKLVLNAMNHQQHREYQHTREISSTYLIGYRFVDRIHMTSINVWHFNNFLKTIAMIFVYLIVNYITIMYIFHKHIEMNIFDLACYYFPNIFISLYVTQFHIAIQQQVYMYDRMNNLYLDFIEIFGCYGTMDHCSNVSNQNHMYNQYQRHGSEKRSILNIVVKLDELIAIHDTLRWINVHLMHTNSLPVVVLIINAFMNIVSEVGLLLYYRFIEVLNNTCCKYCL